PHLNGQNQDRPHETLYWRLGQQWAIRHGDYKLVQPVQGECQLFDLAHDAAEQHDLKSQQPQLASELERLYQAWNAELSEPLWPPPSWHRPGAPAQRQPGSPR